LIIDLRSDASSLPTPAILQAIIEAEIGNDDFGEDPSIRRLEEEIALLLGKPAALFVQSGTMGNLVALLAQVNRGESILVGPHFHVFDHEGEAVERIVGCHFVLLEDRVDDGLTFLYGDALTREAPDRGSRPVLLSLENSVNRLGGTLLPLDHMTDLYSLAKSVGLQVHLDGARLFNAAAALEVSPASLAKRADTVMVTFTKALAAPAGAAVAGPEDVIARARHCRWLLGGNWKQGGVLAAACLTAMRTMMDRIPQDHATARRLAKGLNAIPGIRVNLDRVVTNIIQMHIDDPALDPGAVESFLAASGIKIGRFKNRMSRLVTYKDIDSQAVDFVLDCVREAVNQASRHVKS